MKMIYLVKPLADKYLDYEERAFKSLKDAVNWAYQIFIENDEETKEWYLSTDFILEEKTNYEADMRYLLSEDRYIDDIVSIKNIPLY